MRAALRSLFLRSSPTTSGAAPRWRADTFDQQLRQLPNAEAAVALRSVEAEVFDAESGTLTWGFTKIQVVQTWRIVVNGAKPAISS